MSGSLSDLEKDIEESRARLDRTIDQIQDRLTPGNLVEEMLGTARVTPLNGVYDTALEVVRRNPLPVLMIAVGAGLLLNKLSAAQRAQIVPARRNGRLPPETPPEDEKA